MRIWTQQKSWAPDCQRQGEVEEGEDKDFFEDTDDGGWPDLIDGDNDNDGVSDDDDDMEDDSDDEDDEGHGKPDWWQRKHPGR